MTYENNTEYLAAVKKWQEYKNLERIANEGRLKTEKAILAMVGKDLKEKGTNNFPEGLKITTGMDEKWDIDCVDRIKAQFDDGLLTIPFFPFKQEWKPDNKKLSIINESMPEVFTKVFSEALTIKPKKPSFEIKEKK